METSISPILKEREQFHFILDVISSVKLMVFYAFPHTNIFTRWTRPIWLCFVLCQKYTSIPDILYNKVIIQRLTYQRYWIMRIPRNINPSLVPCSGLFPWRYLKYVHMLWQCLASYMHHAKVIYTGWRGYMNIWIKWVTNIFGYGQRMNIFPYMSIT